MSGSLARAAPMRFLIGVTLAWTVGRGIALAGWRPPPARSISLASVSRDAATTWRADGAKPIAPVPVTLFAIAVPRYLRASAPINDPPPIKASGRPVTGRRRPPLAERSATTPLLMLAAYVPGERHDLLSNGIVAGKAVVGTARTGSRFTGSAWVFVRGGGRASALSPVGQIGGGQMGARLLYRIDQPERLALAARISRTIGGIHQTEAAVGLDWKPIDTLPVHLMLDRRIAINRGGRNAFALGAAGGVDDVHVAPGWRLDGYGEAGVVGAHRRDLYADGAARIARAIDLGSGRSLAIGGGAWGAAQPGAARLDVGPSVVLRAPVAGHFVAVALDWRERIAGAAKPGSGIALTIATDF